jgi:hypothetical protein
LTFQQPNGKRTIRATSDLGQLEFWPFQNRLLPHHSNKLFAFEDSNPLVVQKSG